MPTIFFLNCENLKIQVTVFYKRGEFYWIGDDATKQSVPVFFGDVSRGMNKLLIYFNKKIILKRFGKNIFFIIDLT